MRKLISITGIISLGIFIYFLNITKNDSLYMNNHSRVDLEKEVNPSLEIDNLLSIKNNLEKVKNKDIEGKAILREDNTIGSAAVSLSKSPEYQKVLAPDSKKNNEIDGETLEQKIQRKAFFQFRHYDEDGVLVSSSDRRHLLKSKNGRKYLSHDSLYELNEDYSKMVGDYVSLDGDILEVMDSSGIGHIKIFYKGINEKGKSIDGNSAFMKIGDNHLMFQMGSKEKFYELLYAEDKQKITLKIYNFDVLISSKEFMLSH